MNRETRFFSLSFSRSSSHCHKGREDEKQRRKFSQGKSRVNRYPISEERTFLFFSLLSFREEAFVHWILWIFSLSPFLWLRLPSFSFHSILSFDSHYTATHLLPLFSLFSHILLYSDLESYLMLPMDGRMHCSLERKPIRRRSPSLAFSRLMKYSCTANAPTYSRLRLLRCFQPESGAKSCPEVSQVSGERRRREPEVPVLLVLAVRSVGGDDALRLPDSRGIDR